MTIGTLLKRGGGGCRVHSRVEKREGHNGSRPPRPMGKSNTLPKKKGGGGAGSFDPP